MQRNLPIINNLVMSGQMKAYNAMLVIFPIILILTTEEINKEYFIAFLLIPVISILLCKQYYEKHRIDKAVLTEENIIIYQKNREIYVPLNKVKRITFILLHGHYILSLKHKFPFGKKIWLEYDRLKLISEEPLEIQYIRSRVKNLTF